MTLAKFVVLPAFVLAIAAPALAQPTPPTPEERAARFAKADANKDNKLDKAEFVSSLPEQARAMADQIWFARVDTDGDGFVTKEQYLALRMGPRPQQ